MKDRFIMSAYANSRYRYGRGAIEGKISPRNSRYKDLVSTPDEQDKGR